MRIPDPVLGMGSWSLENGHRLLLKLTGGRFPRAVMGMKPVELHTVGRKSGNRYANLLTAPIMDADQFVLVASKGGSQDHPDWYKNLMAHPDAEITVDDRRRAIHARTATPEERARLWPKIVATYRGYGGYQRNTDREIPVVICEFRDGAAG